VPAPRDKLLPDLAAGLADAEAAKARQQIATPE